MRFRISTRYSENTSFRVCLIQSAVVLSGTPGLFLHFTISRAQVMTADLFNFQRRAMRCKASVLGSAAQPFAFCSAKVAVPVARSLPKAFQVTRRLCGHIARSADSHKIAPFPARVKNPLRFWVTKPGKDKTLDLLSLVLLQCPLSPIVGNSISDGFKTVNPCSDFF